MKEIILTGLALVIFTWYTTRSTIPLLVEWLECMSIDETTIEMEDEGDY